MVAGFYSDNVKKCITIKKVISRMYHGKIIAKFPIMRDTDKLIMWKDFPFS